MTRKELTKLTRPNLEEKCMTLAKIIEIEIPRMKKDIETLKKDSESLKGVRKVLEDSLFPALKKLQDINR